jgi:hypothetical protein
MEVFMNIKENKDVYGLELHETAKVVSISTTLYVTRVPGGWIYETQNEIGYNATFVPFVKAPLG